MINQVESFDAVDQVARELRKSWKLGIDPIPSMASLLEDKGIRVIEAGTKLHKALVEKVREQ